MKPSECSKCKQLFAADSGAQLKMQAEAMRILEETATKYVNKRYGKEHIDQLHESKLHPAPKQQIIKPKTNGGKKT